MANIKESKKLNLVERGLKLKYSVSEAKKKPLLQKSAALENCLDDAVALIYDLSREVHGLRG